MVTVVINMTLSLLNHRLVGTRKTKNPKNVIYLENVKYSRLRTTNQKNDLTMKGILCHEKCRLQCVTKFAIAEMHKSPSYKYFGTVWVVPNKPEKIDLTIKAVKSPISAPNPDCRGKH